MVFKQADIVDRLRDSDTPYHESSLRINYGLERLIDEAIDEIQELRKTVAGLSYRSIIGGGKSFRT